MSRESTGVDDPNWTGSSDSSKIIHMTEDQLQSMLENVFSLSMGNMKTYVDASINAVKSLINDAGVTEARVNEIVTAAIAEATANNITEEQISKIVNDAIGNVEVPVVHTVSFNLDGGTGGVPTSMAILDGGLIPKPADPTKANCEFNGWMASDAASEAWVVGTPGDPDGSSTYWDFSTDTVTKSIILTASWSITGSQESSTS